jgi:hypothetical protein
MMTSWDDGIATVENPGTEAVYAAGLTPSVSDHIRADLGDRCLVTVSVIGVVTAACWKWLLP